MPGKRQGVPRFGVVPKMAVYDVPPQAECRGTSEAMYPGVNRFDERRFNVVHR
jgi:hypothetical protein